MNIANLNKKGQGLPLNTIVIAILVIIVLLVIIVFFTSKIGDTGGKIDETSNSFTQCSEDNQVISTLGYTNVESVDKDGDKSNTQLCKDNGGMEYIAVVGTSDSGQICCGSKTSQNTQ